MAAGVAAVVPPLAGVTEGCDCWLTRMSATVSPVISMAVAAAIESAEKRLIRLGTPISRHVGPRIDSLARYAVAICIHLVRLAMHPPVVYRRTVAVASGV